MRSSVVLGGPFRKEFTMSTKVEVNAMGDACPLPVVKTLKALKQLDGEGAVVTSVDNETAVKNISKMAQEKGCTASVEKISDAEWARDRRDRRCRGCCGPRAGRCRLLQCRRR